MKRAVILPAIDGAAIRRSLAEILSGPVAFPVSRLVSFFDQDLNFSQLREAENYGGGSKLRLSEWFG